jgi:hypothetical protein
MDLLLRTDRSQEFFSRRRRRRRQTHYSSLPRIQFLAHRDHFVCPRDPGARGFCQWLAVDILDG